MHLFGLWLTLPNNPQINNISRKERRTYTPFWIKTKMFQNKIFNNKQRACIQKMAILYIEEHNELKT